MSISRLTLKQTQNPLLPNRIPPTISLVAKSLMQLIERRSVPTSRSSSSSLSHDETARVVKARYCNRRVLVFSRARRDESSQTRYSSLGRKVAFSDKCPLFNF